MNILKIGQPIKMLVIYLIIVWPFLIFLGISTDAGYVSISYNGFAIDSLDNLYVGKENKIEKYYNDVLIGTIDPQTSRAYAFTIKDDTILLSTTSTVYTLDLNGNIVSEREDYELETFNMLQHQKNFTAANGKTYFLKSSFGRKKIVSEDGNVIYNMPVKDYIVKLMFIAAFISAFIIIPIIVYKWRKEKISHYGCLKISKIPK